MCIINVQMLHLCYELLLALLCVYDLYVYDKLWESRSSKTS